MRDSAVFQGREHTVHSIDIASLKASLIQRCRVYLVNGGATKSHCKSMDTEQERIYENFCKLSLSEEDGSATTL